MEINENCQNEFPQLGIGTIPVMIVESLNLRNNGEKTFKTTNRKFKMDFRIFNP